ncbi:MAG: 5-(carboxyamino)imidazole ribonucleotide synthase [Myxococcota bacterium]
MSIAVLGGGQLGRMLALAGHTLDLELVFLDPAADAAAGRVAPLVAGPFEDPAVRARWLAGAKVATYEFENLPLEVVQAVAAMVPVLPPVEALRVAQERGLEKAALASAGIPVAPHALVDQRADLDTAVERLGLPAVLKTRRLGYDGKGQRVLRSAADLDPAWAALGDRPLILEGFVSFERELSILAVRDRLKNKAFYPLIENHHEDGILRLSIAPAPETTPALVAMAEAYAARLLERFDYVGLLTIELFQAKDALVANEIAPRVHNSGHLSIEAAETSQFENHLRAVADLPLGSTRVVRPAAMVNLIGTLPEMAKVLAVPGTHLHRYGKAEKPGRKVGHITVIADDYRALGQKLERLAEFVPVPPAGIARLLRL